MVLKAGHPNIPWDASTREAFFCAGDGCDGCELRYQCFTEHEYEEIFLDREYVLTKAYGDNVIKILRKMTGSKIYTSGTKRFRKLEIVRQENCIKLSIPFGMYPGVTTSGIFPPVSWPRAERV